jgi:integrase
MRTQKTAIPGIFTIQNGYMVRVVRKDPLTGRNIERTKTLTGCFDIQEAISAKEQISRALLLELSEGVDNLRDIQKASFETYLAFWQKWRKNNGVARDNVVKLDNIAIKTFIIPIIGKIRVGQLNKRIVYYFLDQLRLVMTKHGVPYSVSTYSRAYRIFQASVRQAYRFGYIQEDPTHLVSPKFGDARPPKPKKALSASDAAKLLDAASSESSRIYFMIGLFCVIGLRSCEIKALTWGDLDLSANVINISRSHHFGVTNTAVKNGRAFQASLIGILRDAAQSYVSENQNVKASDLLFPSARSRKNMDSTYINNMIARLCIKAGIQKVTAHDLRRTANSVLLLSGVSQEVVGKVLNHKSSQMSEHYLIVDSAKSGEVLEATWNQIYKP